MDEQYGDQRRHTLAWLLKRERWSASGRDWRHLLLLEQGVLSPDWSSEVRRPDRGPDLHASHSLEEVRAIVGKARAPYVPHPRRRRGVANIPHDERAPLRDPAEAKLGGSREPVGSVMGLTGSTESRIGPTSIPRYEPGSRSAGSVT